MHSDLYESFMYLREIGYKYGISETWKPCANRNTHLFFDDHASQIANKIYATHCFIEKTICKPSGFKML
ncbi:hypothetical protein MtrunA17_Chr2g0321981 [Medicago truncatula]|nr:hypothetical protein MtrunA17_Chr2g0321981 [Medicago truncatula]